MKQTLLWGGVIAAILAIIVLIGIAQYRSDCNYIHEWGLDNSQNIESIERPFWKGSGPWFWDSKNNRVYKAITSTGKVVWFRFGNLFRGMEVEQESVDF